MVKDSQSSAFTLLKQVVRLVSTTCWETRARYFNKMHCCYNRYNSDYYPGNNETLNTISDENPRVMPPFVQLIHQYFMHMCKRNIRKERKERKERKDATNARNALLRTATDERRPCAHLLLRVESILVRREEESFGCCSFGFFISCSSPQPVRQLVRLLFHYPILLFFFSPHSF